MPEHEALSPTMWLAVTGATRSRARCSFTVVVRAPDGTPMVIRNVTASGRRHTECRLELAHRNRSDAAHRHTRVRRCVRRAEAEVDPIELIDAHRRYAAERDGQIPESHTGARPSVESVELALREMPARITHGTLPVATTLSGRWGRAGTGPMSRAVAAIDCGTNSTRILVVNCVRSMVARARQAVFVVDTRDRLMHITGSRPWH